MRKVGASVAIAVFIFGLSFLSLSHHKSSFTNPITHEVVSDIGIDVQAEDTSPDIPVTLEIPIIGLSSSIHTVLLNSEKIVETPDLNVGWYSKGVKPGEPGRAALNGHFLNADLTPGIFNRLSQLTVGNEIRTIDIKGSIFKFKVTAMELIDLKDFPLEKVYGNSDKPELTLVTCAGNFDPQSGNYTQRTIVYAELVSE